MEDRTVEFFDFRCEPLYGFFGFGQFGLGLAGLSLGFIPARATRFSASTAPVSLGLVPTQNEIDVVLHASRVLGRSATIDQDQPIRSQFDHVAVMTDKDDGSRIIVERLYERLACVDIQVVGGLVQDQQVRRIACDQGQCQPRAFSTR